MYFRKWNFPAQILKKFLYFLIFLETELTSSNITKTHHIFQNKASLIFLKTKPCTFHFSSLKNILCFRKRKTLKKKNNLLLILFVRISFIRIVSRLNFFQNFLIRIFFIIRTFFIIRI